MKHGIVVFWICLLLCWGIEDLKAQASEPIVTEKVGKTIHSHDRGFYDQPFDLRIYCDTPGAIIHFTLDGAEPSETNGFLYDPAHAITITTTTLVRSIATRPGWQSPPTTTCTYLFVHDVARQPSDPPGWPEDWGYSSDARAIVPADYEMDPRVADHTLPGYSVQEALLDIPTVSIAMRLEDFISDATGIYANPQSRWERKCSVEYVLPNSSEGFQEDCKIEIHGNASRRPFRMQKHSLRLTFTSAYGVSKLKYPLFPESDVEIFNQLVLRACFTDSWGLVSWTSSRYRPNDSQYLRDIWMKDSLRDMGQPSSHGNFVHLYVNGLYFGLHNLTERLGEDFFAEHLGGEPEDWEVNEDFSSPDARWRAMMAIDPGTSAGFGQMQDTLDMENFADYMLLHFYADAEDWPHHNGYAAANAVSGDGRFRFFVWDQEIVLDYHGRAASRIDNAQGAGELFQKLRASAEFRLLFADRVYKHCFHDGALSEGASQTRYLNLGTGIDKAIVAESARWGDTQMSTPYGNSIQQPNPLTNINHDLYPPVPNGPDYYLTREDSWLVELDNVIQNYIPAIHDTSNAFALVNLLRSKDLYPKIDPPEFLLNWIPQHGGYAAQGDPLVIANLEGRGTIYYTLDGTDVRASENEGPNTSKILVAEDAIKFVWVPTRNIGLTWTGGAEPFDDSNWTDGMPRIRGTSGGVGYERSAGYDAFITYDVESNMFGTAEACYVRIPFFVEAEDLAACQNLVLRVRYDDGFAAYLNGSRIASANAATTPAWHAGATASHDDNAATVFQSFDCSNSLELLQAGGNLLAIHGMNFGVTSSDFLISVALVAGEDQSVQGISPSAVVYQGPMPLSESVQVKTRLYDNGQWSALNEAVYSVGPILESLRITELMYHPVDANTEFIELKNIGTESINLNRISFTRGIQFTFPSLILAPLDTVLVVQDPEAFAAEYDTSQLTIAGQYTGRLDNAGEQLQLQDAVGGVLCDFEYKDSWYRMTDGLGYSLTVQDPTHTEITAWGNKGTWQPSGVPGGSPGH
ncbi:MAG: CotH kinase family protein [Phycisphaerae bacterium]|nr:CotH kinase family protein [Phycisphaerae bacterium]